MQEHAERFRRDGSGGYGRDCRHQKTVIKQKSNTLTAKAFCLDVRVFFICVLLKRTVPPYPDRNVRQSSG